MIKRWALCAAAAAVVTASASVPAAAGPRGSVASSASLSLTVGKSRARSCYEYALARNGSDGALEACDGAFEDALSSRNEFATLVNRAIVLAERGQLADALADLEEAVARRPEHSVPHVNLGDVYVRLGRWRDAEQAFSRGIALGAVAPHRAYFGRAVAREEIGDVEGAYADYTMAAELAPSWEEPRRELERFEVVANGGA